MARDYVAFMTKYDAATAARNFAVAFEHYNEQNSDSALKYRSPRELRRRTDSSTYSKCEAVSGGTGANPDGAQTCSLRRLKKGTTWYCASDTDVA